MSARRAPSPAARAALDQLEARTADLHRRLRAAPWPGGCADLGQPPADFLAWLRQALPLSREAEGCPHVSDNRTEVHWFGWLPDRLTCGRCLGSLPAVGELENRSCDRCRRYCPSGVYPIATVLPGTVLDGRPPVTFAALLAHVGLCGRCVFELTGRPPGGGTPTVPPSASPFDDPTAGGTP